jgi:hypothetical protein
MVSSSEPVAMVRVHYRHVISLLELLNIVASMADYFWEGLEVICLLVSNCFVATVKKITRDRAQNLV